MIKRINDDRLSGVHGGGEGDPIVCLCPTVCSCSTETTDAGTLAKWPLVETRNTKKKGKGH